MCFERLPGPTRETINLAEREPVCKRIAIALLPSPDSRRMFLRWRTTCTAEQDEYNSDTARYTRDAE
eukprot:6282366-Lingulodinium_polyedra.AAC.1